VPCLAAITSFGRFLASPGAGIDRLGQIDRAVLERYLAELHAMMAGRENHGKFVRGLNAFFRAIRQHGWDDSLPATAMFYSEDFPQTGQRLPRALPEYVMSQVEDPASLDRWPSPAHRLVTLILMRCGLRITDALRLPCDCVVTDADGAPYLRYFNHKMKREALVPIDEELQQQITLWQQRLLARWPAGAPVLFPRTKTNPRGDMPTASSTYRAALKRWLASIDVRDKPGNDGKRAHITPHQWRHTLGTRLINRDVPQEVVRRILDHDSHLMTSHYARLADTTIRKHWEAARKVNAHGETVSLDPAGPLAEAAWAKQRVSRATQALPNGYCGLPLVQTCPHANSCLTCPMFITTAEFLPRHREHHQQTLQIISAAEARGHTRMAEMNRQVAGNLSNIIASLEDSDGTGHREAADAS
jgi:integrase/ferredoxin